MSVKMVVTQNLQVYLPPMYTPLHPSRSTFQTVRFHRYHLRMWGQPHSDKTPLIMVHGWMDVSASFQFVVDAMKQDRWIIAPDWRGFGLTRELGAEQAPTPYGHADHYVFADYLADLDGLIDQINTELQRPPDAPVDLVGHSMGGNISMAYAGIRPQRIRRLINLEGFGMPATHPSQAPDRYAQWMDQVKALHQGRIQLTHYPDSEAVAQRLIRTNPRLDHTKAHWLAQHWATPNDQGRWTLLGDPAHKIVSAMLYRLDEAQALFQRIQAPVLAVEASDDSLARWYPNGEHSMAQYHQRLQAIPNCRTTVVTHAGHMLHHDQPEQVAQLIEAHLN